MCNYLKIRPATTPAASFLYGISLVVLGTSVCHNDSTEEWYLERLVLVVGIGDPTPVPGAYHELLYWRYPYGNETVDKPKR